MASLLRSIGAFSFFHDTNYELSSRKDIHKGINIQDIG